LQRTPEKHCDSGLEIIMKYCERSIRDEERSNEQILRKIYDHMLERRQKGEVLYRPFTYFKQLDVIHKAGTDFSEIFVDYKPGDYVFLTFDADGLFEKEMTINVAGNKNAEVYFNGVHVPVKKSDFRGMETVEADVRFQKGKNRVIVKVVADTDSFEAYVRILIGGTRMGAGGYVYSTMPYIDTDGYRGQNAMAYSRLYKKNEKPDVTNEGIDWVFPIKPAQTNVKEFNFEALCEKKGGSAYVYTECKGRLVIEHDSPIKIFTDGKVIYRSLTAGVYEADCREFTPLLIKSMKGDGKWGFRAISYGENRLAFVTGADSPDLQWIWAGPFGREMEPIDYPYVPEKRLDFKEPMPSACVKTVYWRFYRENTYLRHYLQSVFWGQWFYAIIVGLEGMRQTAMTLEIEEFYDYFISFVENICSHRDYAKHDTSVLGYASYIPGSARLNNLDAIGTFGISISEYYLMTGDIKAKVLLEDLANSMMTNVPRFPDGTFHRGKTMWTDDMYMCLPFLARLGAIFGEQKYFDEAARQIFGFYERMYMKDQNLYSHIYYPQEGYANRIPWGRGNGWVLLAISEVLMLMPEEHPERDRILEIFREFASGVLEYQDKDEKMWHQVVNNYESYVETSGSAMFITALARGVTYNWLDASIKDVVVEAWEALTQKCVDHEGNVYGVCQGSGCSKEERYYLNLGTIVNDDHGVGIVLGAGVAVLALTRESF